MLSSLRGHFTQALEGLSESNRTIHRTQGGNRTRSRTLFIRQAALPVAFLGLQVPIPGIEPGLRGYESLVLPLNYTGKKWSELISPCVGESNPLAPAVFTCGRELRVFLSHACSRMRALTFPHRQFGTTRYCAPVPSVGIEPTHRLYHSRMLPLSS